MEYKLKKANLSLRLQGDFNLAAVESVKKILSQTPDLSHLEFDLSESLFVNSAAIELLLEISRSTIVLRILSAPALLKQALQTLQLEATFEEAISLHYR